MNNSYHDSRLLSRIGQLFKRAHPHILLAHLIHRVSA